MFARWASWLRRWRRWSSPSPGWWLPATTRLLARSAGWPSLGDPRPSRLTSPFISWRSRCWCLRSRRVLANC